MQLSPHFTLEEMTASQTAVRRGIRNVPGAADIAALKLLCEHVLEPVRAHYGKPVRISSGYRSPRLNQAIGGVVSSQHCFGEAADFTVPGLANIDVLQWIRRTLQYDQLIYEFGEAGWVHCSWSIHGLRNAELTAKRNWLGKVSYVKGIEL